MADNIQTLKIKCPHCGWIRSVTVDVDDVGAPVIAGVLDEAKKLASRWKDLLVDRTLDQANAWLDMPACPHCRKVYQYNVKTGEVRK